MAQGDYAYVMEKGEEYLEAILWMVMERWRICSTHRDRFDQPVLPMISTPIQHREALRLSLCFNQPDCSGIFLIVSGFLIMVLYLGPRRFLLRNTDNYLSPQIGDKSLL